MNIWNYFGSIRCINLYKQQQRYDNCKKLFNRLNVPVTFYRTTKHPISGRQGCYESHISCIRDSYKKGDDTCLIFEDDIITNDQFDYTSLNNAIDFMKQNKEWDIFYLGSRPIMSERHRKINHNIMHGKSLCTHAYIINRKYMEKILNYKYNGKAIDSIYVDEANSYYLYPSLFYQGDYGSDISKSYTKYYKLTTQLIEDYAYYIGEPIEFVISILIIILILFIIIVYKLYNRLK